MTTIVVMFIDSSDKYDIHIKYNNSIKENTQPFYAYLSQHIYINVQNNTKQHKL